MARLFIPIKKTVNMAIVFIYILKAGGNARTKGLYDNEES